MTDAPRYRLVGYDIGTAPDENGGWVHWTDHEVIVARLTAERDSATRAKDCFQRMTRAHWEALCAMRNSINEYIQMPNTDSGPLFSPDDGPIYADIAERVIADLTESRAYALALEQELRDRAEKAEAERDAALAGAVKVKPLVWKNFDAWTYWAKCAFGTYRAQEGNGVWKATLRRGDNTELIYEYTTDGLTPKDFEAAHLAAQADYEARILAAIQPNPEARHEALAKAWQPIETAPKDGTRVMLWRGFISHGEWSEMIIAEWHDGEWLWPDPRENPSTHGEWTDYDLIDGYGDASGPTHWMPLPTPPADMAARIGGE